MNPDVAAFFEKDSSTLSYVVSDPETGDAAIVDPVLNFDHKSGRTGTGFADELIAHIRAHDLKPVWILETHAHADHLSAAPYLKKTFGARVAIGKHIAQVQKVFKPIFNFEPGFAVDGSQFDHLFDDGDTFSIGRLTGRVLYTPGHTPACVSYIIGNAAFIGDTLFMPDYGTARCDFPGGDAATLYRSIRKIFALPDDTRVFVCHDYQPNGRELKWEASVAEQRAHNIHVHKGVSEADFVKLRTERDKTLSMPTLILPSIQVNVRAGELPPPEDNDVRYLKLPIDRL